MSYRSLSLALILALGLMGLAAAPPEQQVEPVKLPARPLGAYRQRVLNEVRRFQKMDGPNLDGLDEHQRGWASRRFREAQETAQVALALSGDREALDNLGERYSLNNLDGWKGLDEQVQMEYGLYPTWPEPVLTLLRAVEPQRPELAHRARTHALGLWLNGHDARPNAGPKDAAVERLTLVELRKAAEHDPEALVRWARLEPETAISQLVRLMNDKEREINWRFNAARALALGGDRRGLEWLEKASLEGIGLGGSPGTALLEAGKPGTEVYFRLVNDQLRAHPGKDLPPGLAAAATGLPEELFFQHLPRLLAIEDEQTEHSVRARLAWVRLPARQLTYLAERYRKGGYEDAGLVHAIQDSLCNLGPLDRYAHQAAALWVDELNGASSARAWERGATIFLRTGLGTPELAAAGARRQLKKDNVSLACRVLGEVGRTEDVAVLWDATHPATERPSANWFLDASAAWLPILRLTSQLPPSAPARSERLGQVIAELVGELDSDRFATREAASAALAELGDLAGPALRKALGNKPSAEVRRRLEALLERLE